jgi:lipoyl-dependent peroxiredoxin
MPTREATTHWHGDLATGSGTVTLDTSKAGSFAVSFPTRSGDPDGQTSPEELIAGAHSACFAMSLANGLATAGTPVEELDVSAAVTLGHLEAGGLGITTIVLTVVGTVPGVDDETFQAAVLVAKDRCLVSKALAGVPSITVSAQLTS